MKSEFGQGFVYCLGLFLGHEARIMTFLESEKLMKEKNPGYSPMSPYALWFNGAADHLFDFQSDKAPRDLKKRAMIFRDKCLRWRISMEEKDEPTQEDFEWAIREAKDMLMAVDRKMGVKVVKGEWE